MNLDALTLSALLDELMDTIVGGRIQDAIDVNDDSIGLEIYADHRRHYLYLSADPQTPRVHLVTDKLRRGRSTPTQLGLLLRRYAEGGTLAHISQPPWERVLHFEIIGPEGDCTLIIEPMERRANLLLVQDGIIRDCLRRVGSSENRMRVSLPGKPYVEPPPQLGKVDLFDVDEGQIASLLAANTDPKLKAAQLLSRRVLGASPLLAREIVFTAHGDADIFAQHADAGALFAALSALAGPLKAREWQPGIAHDERGVTAFSVYPLTHLDGWQRVGSVSEALSTYYGAPVGPEAYTAAKAPIRAIIDEATARVSAKLASLNASMTDDSERELLKLSGELVLAYQYAIQPGQTVFKAEYESDKPPLSITLNPDLTPVENAQAYFARYNKAKRALEDVPGLIADTDAALQQLAQLQTDLDLASNWPEIDEVQSALMAAGFARRGTLKRLGGGVSSGPLRLVTRDGFVIWVGRNSRQNDLVTFGKGSPEDVWLHVRGVPGAHVVIKMDGRVIPDEVTAVAASIAAHYSAKRGESKAPVDVTRVKYVKKIKGAAAGLVTYRNETTLTVSAQSEKAFEKELML